MSQAPDVIDTARPQADRSATRYQFVADRVAASYANFANVNSTREEVVLNFGMNRNWDRAQGVQEVELLHRITLTPHGAKRLARILADLVAEHERRHGVIEI